MIVLAMTTNGLAATSTPKHDGPPALYRATCSIGALGLGYSVPGTGTAMATAIINEYPVAYPAPDLSGESGELLGYVYTTWGKGHGVDGMAYFVGPTNGSNRIINGDTFIRLGPNSIASNMQRLTHVVRTTLKQGLPSRWDAIIARSHADGACFPSDWNGTYGTVPRPATKAELAVFAKFIHVVNFHFDEYVVAGPYALIGYYNENSGGTALFLRTGGKWILRIHGGGQVSAGQMPTYLPGIPLSLANAMYKLAISQNHLRDSKIEP